jgi:rhodanese-related sulfurtransferase
MLKRWNWLIIAMIGVAAFAAGCSDDDTTTAPPVPTDTAFEVMAAAGAAYINDNTICPGIIDAQVLHDNLAEYTVIDVRGLADYNNGHIEGAYHSTLGTLIADLASIPSGKPYVIACYTGQSAGHAKIAMELLGYDDVFSLKFGMAAWNTSLAPAWTNSCGDNCATIEVTDNNPSLTTHSFPTLSGDAGTIVATRVASMLQSGFKAKSYADIQANLGDYFILNYFGAPDYLGTGTAGVPGHIPGAFQYTPYQSLGISQMLKYLPTDKQIIVYCWTGQHSSQVTAYLNMLGYDAYSLRFGANNLFYTDLTANKWGVAAQHDFPIVATP